MSLSPRASGTARCDRPERQIDENDVSYSLAIRAIMPS